MATHNVSIVTTTEQETELQTLASVHGLTVSQIFQDNANKILNAYERNKIDQWWAGLDIATKRTIYNANQG